MRRDNSYLFKPGAKRLDFNLILTILILGVGGYFLLKLSKGFSGLFGNTPSQDQESKDVGFKPVPFVPSESKLYDRLNRMVNLMSTLGFINRAGIVDLMRDLTSNELDWIFVKFGIRTYRHGLLDLAGKQELNLFGWFDRTLDFLYVNSMELIWEKSSYKYESV